MKGELVKFKNSAGLFLDGLYFNTDNSKGVIIHIHGSFGNFYSNQFITVMAESYITAGFNFLTFNLTQHDGITEAVRETNGECTWEYVGYSISKYDSCIDDIKGAIEFAKEFGNKRIILQGHSLGCNRVIHFCNCISNTYEIVLLSPTDSKQLQENWIYPESFNEQLQRLRNMKNQNDILLYEHGVYTKDLKVDKLTDNIPYIPISAKSLLSLLVNPSFNIFASLKQYNDLQNVAFVYYGGEDEYQTRSIVEYQQLFSDCFKDVYFLVIDHGNHSFQGYEKYMCDNIILWLCNNESKGRIKNEIA